MDTFDQEYFEHTYRNYAAQNPKTKLDYYARLVRRYAASRGRRRLLDVGCGYGLFLQSISQSGEWELHGTDASDFAVSESSRRHPDIEVRVAYATDQPFPANYFDTITAFDVLEHVSDLDGVGRSVYKMLKADGAFIFVVPVYDGITGPVIRRLDKDTTHLHKVTRGFWVSWATQWFAVLHWEGIFRYLVPGDIYLHVTTGRLRRHMPAISVVCRKTAQAVLL